MSGPMVTVNIYLQNGQVLRMEGDGLNVKVGFREGKVVSLDWTGLVDGDHLLYLDFDSIAAVSQSYKSSAPSGGHV